VNEKTLSSKTLFEGRIVTLRVDDVQLSNGTKSTREIIEHNPAVVVLPFNSKNEIYLIKQFRKPVETVLIETVAGIIESDEPHLVAAKRELKEETGIEAANFYYQGSAYPAPGFCNELLHFYLAKDLTFGATNFDEDECIECVKYTLDDCLDLIKNGGICDAKTSLSVFYLQQWLQQN